VMIVIVVVVVVAMRDAHARRDGRTRHPAHNTAYDSAGRTPNRAA
jgi:hypothetical protein